MRVLMPGCCETAASPIRWTHPVRLTLAPDRRHRLFRLCRRHPDCTHHRFRGHAPHLLHGLVGRALLPACRDEPPAGGLHDSVVAVFLVRAHRSL